MIKTTTASRKASKIDVTIMPDTITTMIDTPLGVYPILPHFGQKEKKRREVKVEF
jgi:hypothetical protein